MSAIDKNSLAWIGFSALWRSQGLSEKEIEHRWVDIAVPQKVDSSWEVVAEAVSEEAIRRYKAAEWPTEKPVLKVDILAITRDLSR